MREGTAILVAGLLLFSSAGAAAFGRLTMAEPMALVFLLAILFVGLRYQVVQHWKTWGLVVGGLVALLVATKEILTICVPVVIVFGTSWRAGTFCRPEWSRRNVFVVGAAVAAVVLTAPPVIGVMLRGVGGSYESAYGQGEITLARYVALVCYMVLPIQTPSPPSVLPPLYPANLIVGALILSGLLVWLSRERAWQPFWCAAALLSLPLIGALVYLPWPRYEDFYSLPFLLACGLLLAFALETVGRRIRLSYQLAWGLLSLAVLYMAVAAEAATQYRYARRGAHNELVNAMSQFTGVDSVLVVSAGGGPEWYGRAATLERVVRRASDAKVPPILGMPCSALSMLALTSKITVVNFAAECGSVERYDTAIVQRYEYRDWQTFRLRRDSFMIQLKYGGR
jgi:hypothetical protein